MVKTEIIINGLRAGSYSADGLPVKDFKPSAEENIEELPQPEKHQVLLPRHKRPIFSRRRMYFTRVPA